MKNILNKIDDYLTTRRDEGIDLDYEKRLRHFTELLDLLKLESTVEITHSLNAGIKQFDKKSLIFFSSNRYASLLKTLQKNYKKSPEKILNFAKNFTPTFTAADKSLEAIEMTGDVESQTFYVILPGYLTRKNPRDIDTLLRMINGADFPIYKDQQRAQDEAWHFQGGGHVIVKINIPKSRFEDAMNDVIDVTITKEIEEKHLLEIMHVHNGSTLEIHDFLDGKEFTAGITPDIFKY